MKIASSLTIACWIAIAAAAWAQDAQASSIGFQIIPPSGARNNLWIPITIE